MTRGAPPPWTPRQGARPPGPLDIAIVNRFAPPDGAPTAGAAAELAEALREALPFARVRLFASSARYRPADREATVPTVRVRSLYDGRWPPGRLAASLLEGWALARRAARSADLVISLTDPPLLSLWMGPACRRRGRRWIEWTLDRYPEVFAAAGLVGPDHPGLRPLAWLDARLRPDAVIGLGAGQLEHLAARRGGLPPALILPVGLRPPAPPRLEAPAGAPLTLVYAGTLGAAHDAEAVAAIVDRVDPARLRVTLAASGGRVAGLRRRLAGHPAVTWRERLSEADLAAADVHLVSLAGRATHLSVPSKAVTAVCLGRPFLFAGRPEADTWRDLGAAGWLIPEGADGRLEPAALEAALSALADPAGRAARAHAAHRLARELHQRRAEAVAGLAALITGWWRDGGGVTA